MSKGTGTPRAEALAIAQEMIDYLKPYVERIEIAGSLRREKPEVGDIELVIIPRYATDLFGGSTNIMLVKETLANYPKLKFIKGADKYRQYEYEREGQEPICLDLWITTPDKWGVIYFIRTGSADFTHRAMTSKVAGGLMPFGMRSDGGNLWRGTQRLETPEEQDVFEALGLVWIEPRNRIG